MPHYKDKDNKIYFLENDSFKHLLPKGCEKITDEEANEAINLIEESQYDASAEARKEGSRQLLELTSPYSAEEKQTWFKQEQEAKLFLANGDPSEVPFISAMSEARGITLDDLASKIMENSVTFDSACGAILGEQQKKLDELT